MVRILSLLPLLNLQYEAEDDGASIWGGYMTASKAEKIIALGIKWNNRQAGPFYLSKTKAAYGSDWFYFRTAPGEKYHALLTASHGVTSRLAGAYFSVCHLLRNVSEFFRARRLAKPQKLVQLRLMKLDEQSPQNDPAYLFNGMAIGDHYVILGEVQQAPGHVVVFNMSRGEMVCGMVHPERFIALTDDET